MSRLTTMRILFAGWNADNLRAREAYYEHLNALESPQLCRKRLHPRRSAGGCSVCRNERERRYRAEGPSNDPKGYHGQLTEQQKDEVVALYTDALESAAALARAFNVAPGTISSALTARGVPLRNNAAAYQALLERRRRADETERRQESA